MKKYASLYMQTEYSLLSSMLSLDKLKDKIETYNYKAYAITDSAMHGAYKFYNMCLDLGVKPIVGLRLNFYNKNFDNIVLLYAKNMEGYKSLLKISTQLSIKKEDVTKEFIQLNSNGLLAIIPVFENEVNVYYQNRQDKALNDCILEYKAIFEDVYFGISIQSEYERCNALNFISLASRYNLKALAINRCAYFYDDDVDSYRVLKMILQNVKEDEVEGDILSEKECNLAVLSKEEMELRFSDYLELLENTEEVIEKCNLVLDYKGYYFPKAIIDTKGSSKDYLYALSKTGLNKRLKNISIIRPNYLTKEKIQDYKNRLLYELSIIDKMGFNDYFLIVYDYVKYAKTHDIAVGPGRGSAGGSLVSYSLGITDVDPIYFNLLFERFLNPQRIGMPDIDVDFEDEKRNELISHLGERYGKNKVAHITTFGTYKAKLAIRDVARILKLSDIKLKEIMKFISSNLKIAESINNSPILMNMIAKDEGIKRVIEISKKIEGLPKNYSTHAAGIIMADTDLRDYTALQEGIDGLYQTQYEASDLEKIGLVKMDVLGLRNLSIIKNVLKILREQEHIDIDIKNIPLNDEASFRLLASGDTLGIFQLEGSGVTNVLKNLKVSSLEDIIAATSLFRPGPMEMIPSYIKRKFGYEKVEYLDKELESILKPTYGIIVYQEQIMQIAAKYAGYTLGEADILRRAVSKKKASVIQEERNKFIAKATSLGRDSKKANKVYDYIERFASYGFNRSHAVAYALVAYQMAFLKAHYYKAFVSSLMTNCIGSITSLSMYINEARSKGVKIFAPSINVSSNEFVYTKEGIYYPLLGIVNIGASTVDEILKEREKGRFTSYNDFVLRTKNILNERQIEYLVYGGALDEFLVKGVVTRKYMISKYQEVLQRLTYASLLNFKITEDEATVDEFTFLEMSNFEKEALGINLMYNIFIKYNDIKEKYHCQSFASLKEGEEKYSIFIVKRFREIKTKRNELMAFFTLEDESGIKDGVMFSEAYAKYKKDIEVNSVYLAKIKLDTRQKQDDTSSQILISALRKL